MLISAGKLMISAYIVLVVNNDWLTISDNASSIMTS